MSLATPYLSVVVTARNDDHGGNLLRRMRIFVNGFLEQCRRYNVPSELIFVEWNPPSDRKPLADALEWSPHNTHCTVRFLEVPLTLHQRFAHWKTLPLYQMIAKNAGIRRAKGEYVLATNIDILFSNEMFELLAARKLQPGLMYRVDRYDTQADVPPEAGVDQQLKWAQEHLLRVNTRHGTFPLTAEGLRALGAKDIATADAGIYLEGGWFAPEDGGNHTFRWVENDAELFLKQGVAPPNTEIVMEIEPGPGTNHEPFQLDVIGSDGSRISHHLVKGREEIRFDPRLEPGGTAKLKLLVSGGGRRVPNDPRILNMRVLGICWNGQGNGGTVHASAPQDTTAGVKGIAPRPLRPFVARSYRALSWHARSFLRTTQPVAPPVETQTEKVAAPILLHTNACGDFTLLSTSAWHDLRGYPEFDAFSMNIDSVFCWAAHHAGYRETILEDPIRIFHIEHAIGSGWTPEGQAKLYQRLMEQGIAWIDYQDVLQWARDMNRFGVPMIFNRDNWGFRDEQLKETVIRPGETRPA